MSPVPGRKYDIDDEFRTKPIVGRILTTARVIYIARGRADRDALERALKGDG